MHCSCPYFLALRCLALVRLPGADDSCSLSVLAVAGGTLERVVVRAGTFGLLLELELEGALVPEAAVGAVGEVGFVTAGTGACVVDDLPCRSPIRTDAILPETSRSIHLGTITMQL